MSDNQNLFEIAVHEAGHVLSALTLLRSKFRGVSIIANDTSFGRASQVLNKKYLAEMKSGTLSQKGRKYVEDYIVGALSGAIAEAKYKGTDQWDNGSDGDVEKAFDLAFNVCGSESEVETLIEKCIERAQLLLSVQHNWLFVLALAEVLVEAGSLSAYKCKKMHKQYMHLEFD